MLSNARAIRLLLVLGIVIGGLVALSLLLDTARQGLVVLRELQTAPAWVRWLVHALGGVLAGLTLWLVWKLLRPVRRAPVRRPVHDEASLAQAIDAAAGHGVDVAAARAELNELERRRAAGKLYIAMFGEISTGKSALIGALIPDADAPTGVAGGTTRERREYHWQRSGGDEVIVVDVPGSAEVGVAFDRLAAEEAQRAHVVVYVADGDLTRTQWQALEALLALDKPVVLALNKTDRLDDAAQAAIVSRLGERLAGYGNRVRIAPISARPVRRVTEVDADGVERQSDQPLPARLDALRGVLQATIDAEPALLERQRDTAVFALAGARLETAAAAHRAGRAGEIVRTYTRRAVVGGLAAVGPGTDIAIQGVLAVQLTRALAELYEVPVRDLEIERLIDGVQRRARALVPLGLAITGNAFKAFPGIGTLAGGLLHAVAYGLIFDAFGRAVSNVLATRGELRAAPVADEFAGQFREDIQSRARTLAQWALESRGPDERR